MGADGSELSASAAGKGDQLSASQSTLATQNPKKTDRSFGSRDDDADEGPPVRGDRSSNVLFHPPAAHEEHSADSSAEEEDIAVAVAASPLSKPAQANPTSKNTKVDA